MRRTPFKISFKPWRKNTTRHHKTSLKQNNYWSKLK